jgi:hypothetical protein
MAQALSSPTVLLDGSPTYAARNYWTDEQVELLKSLWPNRSASQIASELGLTRNAVIGKVWRLRLTLSNKKPSVPRPPRARSTWKPKPSPKPATAQTPQEEIDPDPTPDNFLGLQFEQLRPGLCRYPRGDGPYFYCGQPTQTGSSFCEYCHQLSHYRSSHHHRNGGYWLGPQRGWL